MDSGGFGGGDRLCCVQRGPASGGSEARAAARGCSRTGGGVARARNSSGRARRRDRLLPG